MKTKSLLLTTIIFAMHSLFFVTVNGQGKAPLWTKEMKSPVAWQKVTSFGQLVACTSEGLIGIDTKTGNQLWILPELKNSPERSYESIANTPFISLSSATSKNSVYIV